MQLEWKNILNELSAIAPNLAKMPREQVFKVPDFYFEAFADDIVNVVQDKNDEISSQYKEKEVFSVPQNYFADLSEKCLKKAKEIEQANVDAIDKMQMQETFAVPEGYFSQLSDKIWQKIEAAESEIIALPQDDGLRVPANYFDTFEVKLHEKIQPAGTPEKENTAPPNSAKPQTGIVRKLLRPALAIAATLALFWVGVRWYDGSQLLVASQNFNIDKRLAQLSDAQLNLLLDENLTDEDLYSLVEGSDLNIFSFSTLPTLHEDDVDLF
ncbi:MAG: hypothetical protein R2798_08275 [Chitinophagales bacterium]|nr:hypothetical protein [Bacteroidota bacterium]MCB9042429.1 hypothetical protein [Chitinophagales bacterium]